MGQRIYDRKSHRQAYGYTGLDKKNILRKIVNIFFPIIFSICFGCSK